MLSDDVTAQRQEGDAQPSSSAGAETERADPERHGVGRHRRLDVSEAWGHLFRLTPTATGWQMTCGHPEHVGGAACTRARSSAIAGEAVARHLLKRWARLGAECSSKGQHKEMWQVALEEYELDALPDEALLDRWAEETHLSDLQ